MELEVKLLLDTLHTETPALPKELNDKLFYSVLEDYADITVKRERMKKMKPGAILINVGRGSLIPGEALKKMLVEGHLGGAILDVTEEEPLPADSPLWDLPNLLITPHVSGNYHMRQILDTVVKIAGENLEAFLDGKELVNEVDLCTGYRKFKA